MQRVNKLVGHLSQSAVAEAVQEVAPVNTAGSLGQIGVQKDDDIVIVSALRTAVCKARRGGFASLNVEDLLVPVFKQTFADTKVDPKMVGDIVVGTVLGAGSQRANECRIASFMAGIPYETPIHTINRQCSSGLQAIAHVAANIRAGFYDMGLAVGVESMSTAKFAWEGSMNPKVFMNKQAKDCLLPMGITSENVAKQFKVSRKEQDELAVASHQKAGLATKAGKFDKEIVPVTVSVKDPKTGETKQVVVRHDDGIRMETTYEGLSKLKPAFQAGGTTTAGNASQVSDGASAVLLTTRANAKKLGLNVMGVFRSFAVAGVPPDVMGIGPAFAIPEALKLAKLAKDDINVYEINEAFASQACMSVNTLGLDWKKVNPNGGAIAVGHALGNTGTRMTCTLLNELHRRKEKLGVVSMCIGSGMGAAGIFEVEY